MAGLVILYLYIFIYIIFIDLSLLPIAGDVTMFLDLSPLPYGW